MITAVGRLYRRHNREGRSCWGKSIYWAV